MNDRTALFTLLENQNKASEQGLILVPDNVVRQELITFSITDFGLNRTTCSRVISKSTNDEIVVQVNLRGLK